MFNLLARVNVRDNSSSSSSNKWSIKAKALLNLVHLGKLSFAMSL